MSTRRPFAVRALSARSSSHCATSIGEYLPLRSPLSSSSAKSLMREKSCGSRGLVFAKTLGDGVSEYGFLRRASTSGSLVYTSGQYVLLAAEGRWAVVMIGRIRLALANAP